MANQTKYQIFLEYLKDLEEVVDKVNNDEALQSDYFKLKEFFLMAGIEEMMIDNIYIDCGFDDAEDFRKQRKHQFNSQTGDVSCSLMKINGLHEAVSEYLKSQIMKDLKDC